MNTAEAGRIAAAREKSQARLREVVQELGRLTGEGLDLADMIGGAAMGVAPAKRMQACIQAMGP